MKVVFTALIFVLLTACSAAAQMSFYDKEFKVGFKYPATMKAISTEASWAANDGFKGLGAVSLRKLHRGVLNASAILSAGAMTQQACDQFADAFDEKDKPQQVKFGTMAYKKIEWVNGGTESEGTVEDYRIYRGGVCYQFTVGATGQRHPLADTTSSVSQLRALLTTLHFGK